MPTPVVIDISHHNTIPSSLKDTKAAGIVGVIHKATEGSSYKDDKLAARYSLAKDAGMAWGGYHFVRPGDMVKQADFFVNVMKSYSDENTLYVLDWEDAGVKSADALKFLQRLEDLTGRSPVLYSGHVCKEDPNPALADYRLWLCHYTMSGAQPTLPKYFTKWWLWQYTDQGKIAGVNPPTDLNAYDGITSQLLAEWAGGDVIPAPTPPVTSDVTISLDVKAPPGVRVVVNVTGAE
jgi:lysozyme